MDTDDLSETLSLNLAVIGGVCSSPADVRTLTSGDTLAQLQVTTRVDGGARSVPVSVLKPPGWVEELDTGDEVLVFGQVRRRFFRAGGTTASRVEIEAEVITRLHDRRRRASVRRRIDERLLALDE